MATQYILNCSDTDWQTALTAVEAKLPSNVTSSNIQALALLPVFSVVIVLDKEVLESHNYSQDMHPDTLINIWAEEENWSVTPVIINDDIELVLDNEDSHTPITPVSVHRYLLAPNQANLITEDKREVAAHIIDDQITSYLKRKLRIKPTYNFSVNAQGQVEDFTFGARKNRQYVDCHILSISQMLRHHKLACFDMDSTLIEQEVIVELAKIAGVGEEVDKITEQAMRGEMDFATSFTKRVSLLKGLDIEVIDEVCSRLTPQKGAFATIAALKGLGYRCVLISGGFMPFAAYISNLLGMDDFYANELDVRDGKLTGEVLFPILDDKQKARIVTQIADEMSIALEEVICIGDGANDLPMFKLADLGIAYHAKPIVQVKADAAINVTGLEGVLYALGYPALTQN